MTAATSTLRVVATSDDRPLWLTKRRAGVTATDIAKLGGNAGRATLERVLAEKRGELAEFRGSASMKHGTEREPVILDWVERKSRAGAFGSGALIPSHDLFAHVSNERYLATPDGRSEDWDFFNELVEIKTTVKPFKSIPADYLRQILWQQFVLGAERTLFVWELRDENFQPVDMEPTWQWVKRDQQQIDELQLKAHQLLMFMDGEAPLPDPVADELISRYLMQADVVAAASEVLDGIKEELRAWIGDRDQVQVLGTLGDLSFLTSSTTRLASTELKKDHPDLWDAYAKTTPTTRLSITPLKPQLEEAQEAIA